MKIFEVITEYEIDGKLQRETQYVTSEPDTLKSVSDHFTTHCLEYEKDFKGVREILIVTEHLDR